MKIDVKLIEYLGEGEAAVELNTGKVVDIFYDPYTDDNDQATDKALYIDDITGTIGQWLDMDTSEIPPEVIKHLQKAYDICVKELE